MGDQNPGNSEQGERPTVFLCETGLGLHELRCDHCGPIDATDEDGCCVSCGGDTNYATLVGYQPTAPSSGLTRLSDPAIGDIEINYHENSGHNITHLIREVASKQLALNVEQYNRDMVALSKQIDKLATYIMENVEGEPSQSQGAVDTAIRVMDALKDEVEQLGESERIWQETCQRVSGEAMDAEAALQASETANEKLRDVRVAAQRVLSQDGRPEAQRELQDALDAVAEMETVANVLDATGLAALSPADAGASGETG